MLNDAIDGGEVAIVFASSDIGPLDGSNATTGKARGADGTRKARRGGAGERSGVVRKRCGSEAAFHAAPRFTRKRTGAMYRRNVRAQCDVGTRGTTAYGRIVKNGFENLMPEFCECICTWLFAPALYDLYQTGTNRFENNVIIPCWYL